MSEERLKFLGRRSELSLKKKNLELRIEVLMSGMREELNPLKAFPDLRTDRIVMLGLELADTSDLLRDTLSELKKIQDLLGG
jgi:hypothetical protein